MIWLIKYFLNKGNTFKIRIWESKNKNFIIIFKIYSNEIIQFKKSVDVKLKPIINGLFCEKIFGPIRNNECYCKLYKKIRISKKNFRVLICPNCYVQITESRIRRYRMGYWEKLVYRLQFFIS
jgi:hypothetical protein